MRMGGRIFHYFSTEFRCSHFWFVHGDWRPFAYSPWLPYWWQAQWLYVLYRCTLCFYFLVWLVYNASNAPAYGPTEKYFIYLSNWSFIMWNLYLLISAVSVAMNQLRRHQCCKKKKRSSKQRKLCCTCGHDKTTICDKISWLLFTISAELAVVVSLLYWTFLSGRDAFSGTSLHIHLVNGIVALLDVWITGTPIHLFHHFYTLVFVSSYAAFTGVYYATNSTGREGENYIYPVLDYSSSPGLAVGAVVGIALVVLPLIHVFFIAHYLVRNWITGRLHKKFQVYRKFLPDEEPVKKAEYLYDGVFSETGSSRLSTHTCSTNMDEECDV